MFLRLSNFYIILAVFSLLFSGYFLTPLAYPREENKAYLMGRYSPKRDQRFSKIPKGLAQGSAVNGYLRKEALEAYIKMQKAAAKDKVKLIIVSATRPFWHQKSIWEKKWTGKRKIKNVDLKLIKDPVEKALVIMRQSSMPGTSRHHWGTEIDINSVNPEDFNSGMALKAFNWLEKNAAKYGFCRTYDDPKKTGRKGYLEEKWHWSYAPLANALTKQYLRDIKNSDIRGFLGSEVAAEVKAIENYVGGISKTCQKIK